MKQTIKNSKMIAIGLFTFCTMGLTNATFAHESADSSPVELKYIGKINNNPVFQLNLNNDDNDSYFIKIKDENANVLYSEKVKGENLSRKYQLDVENTDQNAYGVRVEVTSAKTHKTQVYQISTHTSVTQNIVVAQL